MINTQVLKGNLIRQDFSIAFTLNQGDKGVPFRIELLDNGTPYTLLDSDIVYIEWLKPNGSPFLQEGNIKYGTNYIEFTTPEAVAQYAGNGSFNVIISNNDVRKGTIMREYKVVPTSMKPGSVSEDVITDAITELRNLNTEIAEVVQNNQEIINNNQIATKQDIENVIDKIGSNVYLSYYMKDNITNETAFRNACEYCINNNYSLCVDKNIDLDLTSSLYIPNIFSHNNRTVTINIVTGSLLLSSNITVKNINFVTKNKKVLFSANEKIENVNIDKCTFKEDISFPNLGFRCIEIKNGFYNLNLKDCYFQNYNQNLFIEGNGNFLRIENIEMRNFLTGIYLRGDDPKATDGNWISDVILHNNKFINTKEQYEEYIKNGTIGKDAILLEYVKDFEGTNLTSEYMIERLFYCSYGKNIKLSNVNMYNSGEIKFVGDVRKVEGSIFHSPVCNNISDTAYIRKITSINDIPEKNCFEFYDCKNVYIEDVIYDGGNVANNFISSRCSLENINISKSTIKGVKRAIFNYFDSKAGIQYDPSTLIDNKASGEYDAHVYGFSLKDCTIEDCAFLSYPIIRVEDDTQVPQGTYKFTDFVLSNNNITGKQSDIFDDSTTINTFSSLVKINNINNINIENNKISGYRNCESYGTDIISNLPFEILSNSYKVIIKHKAFVRYNDNDNFLFTNLYVSSGTNIIINSAARYGGLNKKIDIVPFGDQADINKTLELNKNFLINGSLGLRATNTFLHVPIYGNIEETNMFPYTTIFGKCNILNSDGKCGYYIIDKNGNTILKSWSDDVFTVSEDSSKISLYKNRLSNAFVIRGINSPSIPNSEIKINYSIQTVNN